MTVADVNPKKSVNEKIRKLEDAMRSALYEKYEREVSLLNLQIQVASKFINPESSALDFVNALIVERDEWVAAREKIAASF